MQAGVSAHLCRACWGKAPKSVSTERRSSARASRCRWLLGAVRCGSSRVAAWLPLQFAGAGRWPSGHQARWPGVEGSLARRGPGLLAVVLREWCKSTRVDRFMPGSSQKDVKSRATSELGMATFFECSEKIVLYCEKEKLMDSFSA